MPALPDDDLKPAPEPTAGWRLQLADSELAAVQAGPNATCMLQLSAAAMVSPEGLTGYARGVSLRLVMVGQMSTANTVFGRIREGRAHVRGGWQTELSLPCTDQSAARIELQLPHGDALDIDLRAISVVLAPDWRFTESLAC